MHPRPPGMHIGIDILYYFWALSWNFWCADMVPCEDSKTASVRLSVCPSVCLSGYLSSYISNWYINGKVFTSTTAWKPIFFFSNKFEIEFWLVLKSWYQHSSRSQHAPIWRYRGCIVVPSRVYLFIIFLLLSWSSRNMYLVEFIASNIFFVIILHQFILTW